MKKGKKEHKAGVLYILILFLFIFWALTIGLLFTSNWIIGAVFLPFAIIFLYKLIKNIKNKKWKILTQVSKELEKLPSSS